MPKPCLEPRMDRLRKDVRTRYHITPKGDANNKHVPVEEEPSYDPKIYIPSQSYVPPIASPTIEAAMDSFHTELSQRLRANPTHRRHNIPGHLRRLIRQLKASPDFHITATDKNLGPAIMERTTYIKRCLQDHLLDKATYRRLSETSAQVNIAAAETTMKQLLTQHRHFLAGHERVYFTRVFELRRRLPQFYAIPKVHKTPWKTRPIVSCVNSTLGYLSKWVDRQLQRVVHLCPAYLKDSDSLIHKLLALGKLPPTAVIVIADAVSMYTNIDTAHGLQTLRDWFTLHATDLPPRFPTELVLAATELIMTCNVFQFDDTYWLQLCGTAMGTSLACMYATIYYSYHEEVHLLRKFLKPASTTTYPQSASPMLLYGRLIDDSIHIWDTAQLPSHINSHNFIHNIESEMSFGILKWEVEPPSKEVNFLDLTISLNPDGNITTQTYVKANNLHLYIPPNSAHSKGVLKSLIFGNVQRYWTQNSAQSTFIDTTRDFYNHLLNRGYTTEVLNPLFQEVASVIDAKRLANGKGRRPTSRPDQPTNHRRLFLHWEYHPRDISRQSIREAYAQTLEPIAQTAPLSIEQFTLAYHNPQSLRNCLTRTQLCGDPGAQVSNYVTQIEQAPANL